MGEEKLLPSYEKDLDILIERYEKAEQKYRCLYDNSPDLYRTIDISGKIIECNQTYATSLGYTKEEVMGHSIFEYVAENSIIDLHSSFQTWRDTGHVVSREIWMKRKDGSAFPTLLSATNLYDKDGKIIGSNTTIRDITELYNARKEAEEHKKERLSAISDLSSRISHDFRNPISLIKNSVEMMKMKKDLLDKQTIEHLNRIERATARIVHQVDEVLDYVSPKTLQLENHSLNEILNNTLSKINLGDIMINLPEKDIMIVCDGQKLEIVFSNLILNAIQVMDGIGSIRIRTAEQGEKVKVEVEDTGPGIPKSLLPKIFDPLFTTRQVGTGLGLVSCKSIVERHGGTIDVETHIGKGTTFIIILPKILKK
ncbi:MAG: PAS domain S-box protein [Thaumarchaeota archaeon]|nr:PAS domain S-box protein [Nitrososphaerota archaeon]